ncbi:MAG: hypothetical protein RBR05_06440 [Candidatus Methanomethylophilaceae archaeon]|nr:hypothetical protein [Candidatus Methanomethylophilaceae archaeon]MDY0225010.1 hypothetical protein [Candidatus Methanomethylophilaceae archaeon]
MLGISISTRPYRHWIFEAAIPDERGNAIAGFIEGDEILMTLFPADETFEQTAQGITQNRKYNAVTFNMDLKLKDCIGTDEKRLYQIVGLKRYSNHLELYLNDVA